MRLVGVGRTGDACLSLTLVEGRTNTARDKLAGVRSAFKRSINKDTGGLERGFYTHFRCI